MDWSEDEESDGIELLEGEELYASINAQAQRELEELTRGRPEAPIMLKARSMTTKQWAKVEQKQRTGVHTGGSKRTKERQEQQAREKAKQDALLRQR